MDMPEILYKYRPNDCHTLATIIHGKIYFPSISQLNDPFDGSVPYIYDETELTTENIFKKMWDIAKKEYQEYNDGQIHEYVSQIMNDPNREEKCVEKLNQEMREKIEKSFGIYSLTTQRNNFLMWSHYADAHKGICMGFNTRTLLEEICPIFTEVTYQEDLPKHSIHDDDDVKFIKFVEQLLATKSKVWEYEDEYRFIKLNYARKEVLIPLRGVEEIIFGCRMNTSCKAALKEIITKNNPDCKLFECSLNKKKFEIDIKQTA
jgi:hypothetical protein